MIKGLYKYELSNYLLSGKEIAPLLAFIGWIGIAYTIGPIKILKSFGLSSLVIFLIMLIISIGYANIGNHMIEQSFYVKLKNKRNMYLSKVLVILTLSFAISVLGILLPMLIDITSKVALFSRTPTILDLSAGFLLLFTASFSGGIIGLFLNKRVIKQHRVTIILSVFIGLLTILRGTLNEDFFFLRFITWILPPVYELSSHFCNIEYFHVNDAFLYFIWMILYTLAAIFFYVKLMLHKDFD